MKKCLYCGKKIKSPKRKFCCNRHKDKYHNQINPRGYYSEHSGSDYSLYSMEGKVEDSMHPQDPYCLGQE